MTHIICTLLLTQIQILTGTIIFLQFFSNFYLFLGDGVTQSVPILEGYTVTSAVRTVDLAGCDVTAQLTKLLRQKGYSLYKTSAEFELVRDIKERWAFVSTEEADGSTSSMLVNNRAFYQFISLETNLLIKNLVYN